MARMHILTLWLWGRMESTLRSYKESGKPVLYAWQFLDAVDWLVCDLEWLLMIWRG